MKPTITIYTVQTSMGQIDSFFGYPLNFLSQVERVELDVIGYTEKSSNGKPTSRVAYLNSLGKGTFEIEQTKFDNGNFIEKFKIVRVV